MKGFGKGLNIGSGYQLKIIVFCTVLEQWTTKKKNLSVSVMLNIPAYSKLYVEYIMLWS